MVSPSQEQIRTQINKLLPEYAPSGKFARGEQGSFKDFAKEQAKGMKKAGIGVAVGTAAIPSDLLELNKLVNDLAINYGSKNISAIATSVQPQIDFLQQKFGRAKFDQMLNSIGIPSDSSDPAQMTGEIISGLISGKTLIKGLQKGIKKSLPKEKVSIKPKKEEVSIKPKKEKLKPQLSDIKFVKKNRIETNPITEKDLENPLFFAAMKNEKGSAGMQTIGNLDIIVRNNEGTYDMYRINADGTRTPSSLNIPKQDLIGYKNPYFYKTNNINDPNIKRWRNIDDEDIYTGNIFKGLEFIKPKKEKLKPTTTYTKNVYHLGKGKIEEDKFNLMGESDFGIHVGTKGQADSMNKMKYGVVEPTMKPTLQADGFEMKAEGQRTFPLKIADDLKPARIPDIGLFYQPNRWISDLTVASNDKSAMDFMTQTAESMIDLKSRPRVEYEGVIYFMSDAAKEMDVKNYNPKLNQSMVREEMDEQLWKDLVLSSLEEQTRRTKNKVINFEDREVWFNKIKEVANKNGYDSYIYKNTREEDQLDLFADSYMLLEPDQVKYKFSETQTKGDPRLDKYKGGMI